MDDIAALKPAAFRLAEIYALSGREDLLRYSERILGCSTDLRYRRQPERDCGCSLALSTDQINWCRVRLCPPCGLAKSSKLRARLFKTIPRVISTYPTHQFLFLTLTCRNDLVSNSRETISLLNKGWHRLSCRKKFPAVGVLRSLEVTMPRDIYYQGRFIDRMGEKSFKVWCRQNNPDWRQLERLTTDECNWHLHCLLIVPPSYQKNGNYWNHETWVNNWQQSAKLSYRPIVEIHRVTPRSKTQTIEGAILEVSKYTTKPDDLIQSPNWTIELTDQIKGVKSFTVSGILRQFIRQSELDRLEATGDFGDETKQEGQLLRFLWNDSKSHYDLAQIGDRRIAHIDSRLCFCD